VVGRVLRPERGGDSLHGEATPEDILVVRTAEQLQAAFDQVPPPRMLYLQSGALDAVDRAWLNEHYRAGVMIIAINAPISELGARLEVYSEMEDIDMVSPPPGFMVFSAQQFLSGRHWVLSDYFASFASAASALSTSDEYNRMAVAEPTLTPPSTPSPAARSTTPPPTPTPESQLFSPIVTGSLFSAVDDVALSDDGRYAAVIQGLRLFRYDALTGESTRLGSATGGVYAADISANGLLVAYWGTTEEVNDLPGEGECQNPASSVCGALFVYDVTAGATISIPFGVRLGGIGPRLDVAVADNGVVAANGDGVIHSGTFLIDSREGAASMRPISPEAIAVSLSDDGRYLAYLTSAGVFVYDAATDTSIPATADWPAIEPLHKTATNQVDMSNDGRFLVFASIANMADRPLTPCVLYTGQELPFCRHVYLIDRATNQVELISVSDSGEPANGVSLQAFVSNDGRFVLFDSFANNLADAGPCADPFGCPQAYLRDRQGGRTILLSRLLDGQMPNNRSFAADLSGNAAYAAVISSATNLNSAIEAEPFDTAKGLILDLQSYLRR
jgi:hypothetical protein